MIYQDTMNQQRLIRFMDCLVRASQQKVFLILDNLKDHHGKLAAGWREKHKDKFEVSFLPPYTIEDIAHKMQSFMRKLQHQPSRVSSFFRHPSLSYLCMRK